MGAEIERGRRGGRREQRGGYLLVSLHTASISPEVGSLHGKLPCDQEGRSGLSEPDTRPEEKKQQQEDGLCAQLIRGD